MPAAYENEDLEAQRSFRLAQVAKARKVLAKAEARKKARAIRSLASRPGGNAP